MTPTDPDGAALLAADFHALCDCGGRLAGTDSCARALAVLERAGRAATGAAPRALPLAFQNWRVLEAALATEDGTPIACHPLVRSAPTPPGGLAAEVLDLGRGTPEEFEAHAAEIPGRIVLVRHELMFAAGTIHRGVKYRRAVEAGAAGFLIAGPAAGSLVAGSSGRGPEAGIPAVGIAPESAARLRRSAAGRPRVRLLLRTEEFSDATRSLLFEVPGETDEWVVLSAHVDGHDLAESAMDNASGAAAALHAARLLCRAPGPRRRGLRLAFFNLEEWALTGSAEYVAGLDAAQRARIVLNVNLDSVGCGPLTALTSGYAGLEPFLLRHAEAVGMPLGLFRPLQRNSDHANFAQAGIPALRLVSGFNDAGAPTRDVLTRLDTRDRVELAQLQQAAALAAAVCADAMQASDEAARAWRG